MDKKKEEADTYQAGKDCVKKDSDITPPTLQATPEKIDFALAFVDMLADLESSLHVSDDPKEIAHGAMKMACDFYQADWCGFLMVDLDLGLWTPYWWYNVNPHDRTEELTNEYCVMPREVRTS